MVRRPPLPRNAIELPLYSYLFHEWWPPIQLVLARPWRDADENLGLLDPRLSRASSDALAGGADPGEVEIVIEQDARCGPKRATGSAQFVLQLGVRAPTRAHAILRVWRDRAIEHRRLGVQELADKAARWRGDIVRLQRVIDQEKRRSAWLAASPVHQRVAAYVAEPERARANAVIAARGTAALCGGRRAPELLADAFARYAAHDATLSQVTLPATDDHVYDPDVHELAAAFCGQGLAGLTRRGTPIYTMSRVTRPRVEPNVPGAPLPRSEHRLEF